VFPRLRIEHSGGRVCCSVVCYCHLLYYAHKLDVQTINIKWRAWPPAAVAQAWEPAQGNLAVAPSADSGPPLATGTHDDRSRRGFSDFSRL